MELAGSLPPRDKSTVLLFIATLSIVVLLVLGIACANVANLLLAAIRKPSTRNGRSHCGRSHPRSAGARRCYWRACCSPWGAGWWAQLCALWATSALSAFRFPAPVPLDLSLPCFDWRGLLYTFALSAGTGLLLASRPAWTSSRPILASALKGEDGLVRPGRRLSLRNVLVVTQIVMSVVLLCATGLFLRSLERAVGIDIGFRSRDLLMLSVDPRVHGYTPERTTRFLDQLRARVAAIPGVISVAATDSVPLSGGHRSDGFSCRRGQSPPNQIRTWSCLWPRPAILKPWGFRG